MSSIAEAFIYTYLGLTFVSLSNHAYSITFIFFELLIVIMARYISVYSLSGLLKYLANYIVMEEEKIGL